MLTSDGCKYLRAIANRLSDRKPCSSEVPRDQKTSLQSQWKASGNRQPRSSTTAGALVERIRTFWDQGIGTDAYEYSCVAYLALRNRERPILPQYVHTSALPNGLLNEVYTTSWLLTVQYQLPQNKEGSGELVSCPDPTFSRGKRV